MSSSPGKLVAHALIDPLRGPIPGFPHPSCGAAFDPGKAVRLSLLSSLLHPLAGIFVIVVVVIPRDPAPSEHTQSALLPGASGSDSRMRRNGKRHRPATIL